MIYTSILAIIFEIFSKLLIINKNNFFPPHEKEQKTLLRLKFTAKNPQREHNSGLAALKRPPSRQSLPATIF